MQDAELSWLVVGDDDGAVVGFGVGDVVVCVVAGCVVAVVDDDDEEEVIDDGDEIVLGAVVVVDDDDETGVETLHDAGDAAAGSVVPQGCGDDDGEIMGIESPAKSFLSLMLTLEQMDFSGTRGISECQTGLQQRCGDDADHHELAHKLHVGAAEKRDHDLHGVRHQYVEPLQPDDDDVVKGNSVDDGDDPHQHNELAQ